MDHNAWSESSQQISQPNEPPPARLASLVCLAMRAPSFPVGEWVLSFSTQVGMRLSKHWLGSVSRGHCSSLLRGNQRLMVTKNKPFIELKRCGFVPLSHPVLMTTCLQIFFQSNFA